MLTGPLIYPPQFMGNTRKNTIHPYLDIVSNPYAGIIRPSDVETTSIINQRVVTYSDSLWSIKENAPPDINILTFLYSNLKEKSRIHNPTSNPKQYIHISIPSEIDINQMQTHLLFGWRWCHVVTKHLCKILIISLRHT